MKIHRSTGQASDIRLSLYDMLQMPLLNHVRYRLCLTASATRDCTFSVRFNWLLPAESGEIQQPDTCVFHVQADTPTRYSCEFTGLTTTESDRFTFFFGRLKKGTRIILTNVKLHMLR